uniref:Uncharacterized protein n=1 Tax=Mustela putorius furo TaxID=9669 RepID=M3XVR7_MUSPF
MHTHIQTHTINFEAPPPPLPHSQPLRVRRSASGRRKSRAPDQRLVPASGERPAAPPSDAGWWGCRPGPGAQSRRNEAHMSGVPSALPVARTALSGAQAFPALDLFPPIEPKHSPPKTCHLRYELSRRPL